jgi:hypothetical protein
MNEVQCIKCSVSFSAVCGNSGHARSALRVGLLFVPQTRVYRMCDVMGNFPSELLLL